MSNCVQCTNMLIESRQAQGDLVRVAKLAAANPSPRNVEMVSSYKAERDEKRKKLADHQRDCTGESVPA